MTENLAASVELMCSALSWEAFGQVPRVNELQQRFQSLSTVRRDRAPASEEPAREPVSVPVAPRRSLSVVVIADVGGDTLHVGDEAMLLASIEALRRLEPAISFTLVAAPAPRLRERLEVDAVLSPWEGTLSSAPESLLQTLAEADALLISGGGHLSSSWPGLLRQRIIAMREAQRLGKPVLLSSHTLGPELDASERQELAQALRGAAHVGVRDVPSLALALGLNVPLHRLCYQPDDALLLSATPPLEVPQWVAEPWIAITLDASFGSDDARTELRSLAAQLAAIGRESGSRLVFIPHFGPLGAPTGPGDGSVGLLLQVLLAEHGTRCELLPVFEPRAVVWLTRRAAAVVSSRYHALVFATAAGVPGLGIWRDAYTRIKLQGALAHFEMAEWTVSSSVAEQGGLVERFGTLWSNRVELRRVMLAQLGSYEIEAELRWARLLAVMRRAEAPPPGEAPAGGLSPARLASAALVALECEREARGEPEQDRRALRAGMCIAEEYAASLEAENERLRQMRGEAERYALSLEEERQQQQQDRRALGARARIAEEYAASLKAENERLRQIRGDVERYAQSLEEERQGLKAALLSVDEDSRY